MLPATQRLIDAVASHHRPRWTVSGTGGDWLVTAGTITLARDRSPAVQADLTVVPAVGASGPVPPQYLPFGSTASITWGVDPWPETLTVADTLHVVVASIKRPDGVHSVKLHDPSSIISKHTLPETETISPEPANCLQAVQRLVQRTFPTHTVLDPTGAAAATPVPEDWRQSDPWSGVQRAAQAAGLYPHYTAGAEVTLDTEPASAGPVVDTITAADHITGYEITYERAYSRALIAYDNVTGQWDAVTGPLVGLPPSTYLEKREGTATQAAADAAAHAWADRAAGRVAQLTMECVPRPWLRPGDRVGVELLHGTVSQGIVDEVTLPLDGSPMRLKMRNSDYIAPAHY